MPKMPEKKPTPKAMFTSFKVFLKSIKKYRFPIVISIILTIGSAILGIIIPKILGDMTNIAVNSYPNLNWSALGEKAILIIVLFCSSSLLGYGQAYILAVVSAKIY